MANILHRRRLIPPSSNYRVNNLPFLSAKVSLDRANSFLLNTELLDRFAKEQEKIGLELPEEEEENDSETAIGFRNATFSWSLENNDGSLTPSSRKYRLHIDGELLFKKNSINLIVGPT